MGVITAGHGWRRGDEEVEGRVVGTKGRAGDESRGGASAPALSGAAAGDADQGRRVADGVLARAGSDAQGERPREAVILKHHRCRTKIFDLYDGNRGPLCKRIDLQLP